MLTPRLQAIADNVPAGTILADIGTDHGYLPVELVKRGTILSGIAGDINEGPLDKARRLVKAEGLCDKIETRLGSGLEILAPGEANVIVLAGMGGYLIRDLLEAKQEVAKQADQLILQPMNNAPLLRHYLEEQGYRIINEDIAKEDFRLYEIIVCTPGEMTIEDTLDYLIGYESVKGCHPLLGALIDRKIEMEMRILESTSGKDTPGAKQQYQKSQAIIAALREVKNGY